MRILVRGHIYRAFPELDEYTDEQCQRFVLAAQRNWVYRIVTGVAMLLVGLTPAGLGSLAATFVVGYLSQRNLLLKHDWLVTLGGIVVGLPLLAGGPFLGALTRDVLLRRRVRKVLRVRGVCPGCRYSLIGLPVGEGNLVICPECQASVNVDESLGELVRDEQGRARFQPVEGPGEGMRFWTRERIWRVARPVLKIAGVIAVLAGIVLAWNEYRIRADAAAALAQAPTPADVLRLAQRYAPGAGGSGGKRGNHDEGGGAEVASGKTAWGEILTLALDITNAMRSYELTHVQVTPDGNQLFVDFATASSPGAGAMSAESAAEFRLRGEYARGAIAEWLRTKDFLKRIEALADLSKDPTPVVTLPIGSMVMNYRSTWLVVQVNQTRMRMALEAGDRAGFESALKGAAGLRACLLGGTYSQYRSVAAHDAELVAGMCREALRNHPEREWVETLARWAPRDRPLSEEGLDVELHRLEQEQGLTMVFGVPGNVRWGQWSPGLKNVLGSMGYSPQDRLGGYAENTAALDSAAEEALARARTEWFARPQARVALPDLTMLRILYGSPAGTLNACDRERLALRGLRVMIALERFRLANGAYPETLSALVPSFLETLPLDTYSGKPLCYQRGSLTSDKDPRARGYVLYSTGPDGVDHGGLFYFNSGISGTREPTAGEDLLLLDWP